MSKADLSVMDIYPMMLQDAYDLCEQILEDYGYSKNQFFQYFNQDLEEYGLQDLSNRLVGIMFLLTSDLIHQSGSDADVYYYINGTDDTHFYINGEEM